MYRFAALLIALAALCSTAYTQSTGPSPSPAPAPSGSYTVSSGALSTPYSDLSSPTNVNYPSATYLSGTISPAGFSFSYFGQTFTDFRIASSGYILVDSSSSVTSKYPAHTNAPGYVISPCWTYLDPNGSLGSQFGSTPPVAGKVGYEYSNNGVLTVEWYCPSYGSTTTGVRMQCVIDTGNGTIEFKYGSMPSGTTGATGTSAQMVAISSGSGTGQEIIPGTDGSNVSSTGVMQTWPAGRYIRFTPATSGGNNPPTLSVSTTSGSVTNGGSINVNYNDTLASLGLDIVSDDPDNDDVKTTVTITNLGSTGIDTTEWESGLSPTPYTLSPTTGTFNTPAGVTHMVTLTANDAQTTSNFSFSIVQAAGSLPSISVSDSSGGISPGASASGTPRAFGSQDTSSGPTAQITITINNTGNADLTVTNLNITGTDAGQFVLDTASFNGTVAQGSSTSFGLEFDPNSAGAKVATVTFNHDDTTVTNPFTFEITGTGTTPAPAPILVVQEGGSTGPQIAYGAGPSGGRDFGSQDIGAGATASLTIYIENNGNADLTLGTPTVSSGEFTVDDTGMATTVTQGSSTTFTVAFDPSTAVLTVATISFIHNDGTQTTPFEFDVRGTGTTAGGNPGGGGTLGGGSGGGGGGCVAATGHSFWALILALGAILGAWHLRRRAV